MLQITVSQPTYEIALRVYFNQREIAEQVFAYQFFTVADRQQQTHVIDLPLPCCTVFNVETRHLIVSVLAFTKQESRTAVSGLHFGVSLHQLVTSCLRD